MYLVFPQYNVSTSICKSISEPNLISKTKKKANQNNFREIPKLDIRSYISCII